MKRLLLFSSLVIVCLFTLLWMATSGMPKDLLAAEQIDVQQTSTTHPSKQFASPKVALIPGIEQHPLQLYGKVLDYDAADEPLYIQVVNEEGQLVARERLNADGTFHFQPLLPSYYQLQLVDANFHPVPSSADSHTVVRGDAMVEEYQIAIDQTTWQQMHMSSKNSELASGQPTVTVSKVDSQPTEAEMVIQGVVSGGDQRLGVLTVLAKTPDGVFSVETSVTSDGSFVFAPLPRGDYRLQLTSTMLGALPLLRTSHSLVIGNADDETFRLEIDTNEVLERIEQAQAGQNFLFLPMVVGARQQAVSVMEATQPQTTFTGAITGVVTAEDSGLPLQSIYIYAYKSVTDVYYSDYALTDFQGRYTLNSLESGNWYLEFRPYSNDQGYVGEYYADQSSLASATVVTVGSTTVPNINAQLSRGGSLQGFVTDATTGLPIHTVNIWVYTSTTASKSDTVARTYTGGDGQFRLVGLEAGQYYLYAERSFSVYSSEYYNNKPSLLTADAVKLSRNVTTTVNFTLDHGGVITGMITDAQNGLPLANAAVYLYDNRTSSLTDYTDYIFTNSLGQYRFEGLTSGNYYLRAIGSGYLEKYYNNKGSLASADTLAISVNMTQTNINLSLDHGGVITGVVTDALTGQPLSYVGVHVYTSTTALDYYSSASADFSGRYSISDLPAGIYYLEFVPPFGSPYIREFYNNKRSLATADGINVAVNSVIANRNVALDRGGVVVGKVKSATTNLGIPNAVVRIYTSTVSNSYDYITAANADSNGRYTTTALAPANYYLAFSSDFSSCCYQEEYYNNKSSLALADPITLSLNTTTTLDAALDALGTIEGQVTDETNGVAISGIRVYAYTTLTQTTPEQSTEVDTQGHYSISGLEAGTYYLWFVPQATQYVAEYYDNKQKRSESTPISVSLNSTSIANAALIHTGRIGGRVTSSVNGSPLLGVGVTVYARPEAATDLCGNPSDYTVYVKSDFTDSAGNYLIEGIPPGDYKVTFDPNSFQSPAYTRHHFGTSQSPVIITSDAKTTVDASLTLGARISGQVIGEDSGEGLADVRVYFYRKVTNSDGTISYYAEVSAETDDGGNYISPALIQGAYRVDFDPDNYGVSNQYVEEYYDNQLRFSNATSLEVATSAIISNINAVLALGGQITGTVTSEQDGLPIKDITVYAYGINNFGFNYAYTDANGNYVIDGLAADSYRVRFVDDRSTDPSYAYEYYNDKPSWDTMDGVAVQSANATPNINAALALGGSINGIVVAQDTGKPLSTRAYAIDVNGYYERSASTNSNTGGYSIKGLRTGTYKVWFSSAEIDEACQTLTYPGLYYNQKPTEEGADPVNVVAPTSVNNINAALPLSGTAIGPFPGMGVIAGTVVNAANQPLANIQVTLYQKQSNSWNKVASGSTDGNGNYTLAGLAPANDYRVFFSDPTHTYADEVANDAQTLEDGNNVDVGLGHTTTLNVTLSPITPPLITVISDSATAVTNPQSGEVTIRVPRADRKSIIVTRSVQCDNSATPNNVTLVMELGGTLLHEYPMTSIGNNHYQVTIPESDLVNGALLKVRATCASTVETSVGRIVLYDPSGIVSDATTGDPVAGATITLYRVPGWKARTFPGDTTVNSCESNSSKPGGAAWSQVAPTQLGVLATTLTGEISPALNPQQTAKTGYYGWEVSSGCWYVVVAAPGYAPKVSPVVGVPSAVTDLDIQLGEGKSLYLPLVAR